MFYKTKNSRRSEKLHDKTLRSFSCFFGDFAMVSDRTNWGFFQFGILFPIALLLLQSAHAQQTVPVVELKKDYGSSVTFSQHNPIKLLLQKSVVGRSVLWETDPVETETSFFENSPGTLFLWTSYSDATGGPDLSEPLVTDRPDFTEASVTVGEGVAQLEFGYTYTYNNSVGVSSRTQSAGEPLLRYGMFRNWFEFRLGVFPIAERTRQPGISRSIYGLEDLYLGTKIALTPQVCAYPEMAIIFQTTVPTGRDAFSNNEMLHGINWLYSWEITKDLTIGGSSQWNRALDGQSKKSYTEFAQSLTCVIPLSEKIGSYFEWYGLFPHSANSERVKHFLNSGCVYLVNHDLQLDIRAGKGLTTASDDYFIGVGATVRYH